MAQYVSLYGFIRRKDGLRTRPQGVNHAPCYLFHSEGENAAVISLVNPRTFQSNETRLIEHEEAVREIFGRQVICPVRFPKILTIGSLRRNLQDMDREISLILRKLIFKNEFHIRVMLIDYANVNVPSYYYNVFSKYILEHASQFRYKHYFPILTKEAQEAEFINYAEHVIHDIYQKLKKRSMYWRAKTFRSERLLLDAYFWTRKHQNDNFLSEIEELKSFYPNVKLGILGPYPPFNFHPVALKHYV